MRKDINEITKYLFDRLYSDEITDDEEDAILDQVDQQISEFGWDKTYASWKDYLMNSCNTPESALNFANLFWWYGGQDHPIPDPYQLLGYLYYRIGLNTDSYEVSSILDSLATNILPKAGYCEADLLHNPNYVPESDPQIIAAAEAYKLH